VSSTTEPSRPRRFFGRLTMPFGKAAKDQIGKVEDKVRASVQAEIDAVSQSMRAKAVQFRPSAIAFAVAMVLTVTAFFLLVVAAVVGLTLAGLALWLAAIVVAAVLLLAASAAAWWGRHHLPAGAGSIIVPMPMVVHPAPELVHPWAD
jgi:uncharacterized membrane protein